SPDLAGRLPDLSGALRQLHPGLSGHLDVEPVARDTALSASPRTAAPELTEPDRRVGNGHARYPTRQPPGVRDVRCPRRQPGAHRQGPIGCRDDRRRAMDPRDPARQRGLGMPLQLVALLSLGALPFLLVMQHGLLVRLLKLIGVDPGPQPMAIVMG